MVDVRIRLVKAELSGEVMLEGQRAFFEAKIDGERVDVEFKQHPVSDRRLDQWQMFRALEAFIDRHLRG